MTLFPDIQKRAQAEVDSVLGTGRLPTLRDRENLPYIDAVVKELLRWRPIFPLGQSRAVFIMPRYGAYSIFLQPSHIVCLGPAMTFTMGS